MNPCILPLQEKTKTLWSSIWRWLPCCQPVGQSLLSVLKIKSFLLTLWLCSQAQIISSNSASDHMLKLQYFWFLSLPTGTLLNQTIYSSVALGWYFQIYSSPILRSQGQLQSHLYSGHDIKPFWHGSQKFSRHCCLKEVSTLQVSLSPSFMKRTEIILMIVARVISS